MFSQNFRRSDLAKLDVLETKFEMYEELSRSMLEKLDAAVSAISENSNKIALVLEKHDSRLLMSEKFDQDQVERIKSIREELKLVKDSNTAEHEAVIKKMNEIENRVDSLLKWRWQTTAVIGFLVFIVGAAPNILNFLYSTYKPNSQSSFTSTEILRKV